MRQLSCARGSNRRTQRWRSLYAAYNKRREKKTLIYPHKETLELRNKGDVNTRAEKYEWMTINADSIQSPVKGCVMSRDRRETRC